MPTYTNSLDYECSVIGQAVTFNQNVTIAGDLTSTGGASLQRLTFPQTDLAAAGTNQATAALIVSASHNVTGADGTKGVIAPPYPADVKSSIGHPILLYNNSASMLKVYPDTGSAINGLAANAAIIVLPRAHVVLTRIDATNLTALMSNLPGNDIGTATASAPNTVSGAATVSKMAGVVTTDTNVNSAAGAIYTLTLTNTLIAATSIVLCSAQFGTATTGEPTIARVTPAAGSCVIVVFNSHLISAFNGSLKISFLVV